MSPRNFFFAGLAALLVAGAAFAAATGDAPQPPCGSAPVPAYPAPSAAPNIKLWTRSDLSADWSPPACTAWQGPSTIIVGLAGHFHFDGGANLLLSRIGAISSLTQVRYWSVTDGQWANMFTRATALDGARKPRADFSAAELRAGGDFHFLAADNRSGKDATSQLHVIAADGDHFVMETENATPLRWAFLTYAAPGNFQTWYFLDPEEGGNWRFYSVTRVLYASPLFGSVIPNQSYINRAVAMYRHFVGIQTDLGPPPAP